MKRFTKAGLSLGLCLALAAGLMTLTAGAAFTDASRIEHRYAVEFCSDKGIINGMPDGSYQPQKNVTRAQMSKMICVALNGGQDPKPSAGGHLEFQDIVNHWAAPYIQMCADRGIVAGVGGGRFNPDGSVTGIQAAKMLLTALGYNQSYEEYIGPSWAANVTAQAEDLGLYNQIKTSYDFALALNRDNAAQMIYNTLWSFEVDYDLSGAHGSGPVVYNLGRTFLDAHFMTPPPGVSDPTSFQSIAGEYRHAYTSYNEASGVTDRSIYIYPTIHEDGTFTGHWQWTDNNSTGPEHPKGTICACSFEGKLLPLNHVTAYHDFLYIQSIQMTSQPVDTIQDGYRIVTALPDLYAGDRINVYHKGTPMNQLPNAVADWLKNDPSFPLDQKPTTMVPDRILYSPARDIGFLTN